MVKQQFSQEAKETSVEFLAVMEGAFKRLRELFPDPKILIVGVVDGASTHTTLDPSAVNVGKASMNLKRTTAQKPVSLQMFLTGLGLWHDGLTEASARQLAGEQEEAKLGPLAVEAVDQQAVTLI